MKIRVFPLLGQLGIEIQYVEHVQLTRQIHDSAVESCFVEDTKRESKALLGMLGCDKSQRWIET